MTEPLELPIDERLSYSKAFVHGDFEEVDPAKVEAFVKKFHAKNSEGRLASADDYAGRGAVAPRVTLKGMEDKIVAKHFVNAGSAVVMTGPVHDAHQSLDLLTLCFLVMANGFTVVGKSACASPENYDKVKGETFAYEDAIDQLWALEGYQLRSQLAGL